MDIPTYYPHERPPSYATGGVCHYLTVGGHTLTIANYY
jgi:hypothetical protein